MWAQRDWPGQGGLKGEGVVVFPKNSGCVVEFLGGFLHGCTSVSDERGGWELQTQT